mmetsp:Transcript_2003/g.4661  ORF Transcript_2003/g.4661 Transcript_2003/m.4661 type:complete len:101 (-) Transcript_2003:2148-2450(-)
MTTTIDNVMAAGGTDGTDTKPHRVWEQRDPITVGAMRRVDSLDLAVLRGLPESGARKSRKSRIGLESSKEDKGDKSPCTSRTSMSGALLNILGMRSSCLH